MSASAVVSAVAAYAKINAAGQWVERSERVNLNELFGRMTPEEMEAYATDGTLPAWFQRTIGSTESLSATALQSRAAARLRLQGELVTVDGKEMLCLKDGTILEAQ